MKIYKQNYEEKLKNIENKENQIGKMMKDIQLEISKKIKNLEKDQQRLKENNEKLILKESVLMKQVNYIKEESKKIQKLLNTTEANIVKTPLSTPKNKQVLQNTDEISKIEQEILSLEQEYETSCDKDSIKFHINRLKNKISLARSKKALNLRSESRRFSSFSSTKGFPTTPKLLHPPKLDFSINIQDLPAPRTPKMNSRALTFFGNFENSYELSPQSTLRNTYSETISENIEKDENLIKFLELKDLRLKKKEEELNKKELKLQNS